MGCCYFGKLPARSDFVIGQCPKGFLKLWEPFLMHGLAQSRQDLGEDWRDAYMTMPVWRFELSVGARESVPFQSVLGAFMPSVDGVGREFPLTVAAGPDPKAGIAALSWFERVEIVLRSALLDDTDLSDFQDAVTTLEPPDGAFAQAVPAPRASLAAGPDGLANVSSRFWCQGGNTQYAFGCEGLPEASEFRWLLLPERFTGAGQPDNEAGDTHGRTYPEDHRT